MRNIFLITILTLLTSCKSFNDYMNQKVVLKPNGIQKMNFDNNQYISKFNINGKEADFLVDTGAMGSVITDTLFLKNFNLTKENFYTSMKIRGAGGVEIESDKFITDSVSSTLFNSSNKIFSVIKVSNIQNKICSDKAEIKKTVGIIGFDFFKAASSPILLDFENKSIKSLKDNYSTDGYTKINAKINNLKRKIIVTFNIDNKDVDFLFDTGNSGGFLLMGKEGKFDEAKILQKFSMIFGTVNGFDIMNSKIFKDINIKLEKIFESKCNVIVLEKLTTNTLGISFIKNFNWILNFNTGEIYVKKISEYSNQIDSNSYNKDYIFANINSKLLVGFKKLIEKNSKFNVGDEITSINNQKVTEENICEMQDLLNNTEDWNTLKLEVISKL
jgi:predicted aspartyl protease